ncbi:hypothetical protein GCM10023187_52010 [Nibrella viscosa]|uniref:Sulfatase-modifying factor enzyme-like domain-containing protein n=1 Tax=Nibrella viscosa TaxID=1084524 RepID=A0ABP8KYD3_9BACT
MVIGNKDYQFANRLTNPVNDAKDISEALKQLGFSVTPAYNTDYRTLQAAINRFTDGLTSQTRIVGSFPANALGLFDMSGNVAEWCQDAYDKDYYANSANVNPTGSATEKVYRVLRGGSWADIPESCRITHRLPYFSTGKGSVYGFRIVASLP